MKLSRLMAFLIAVMVSFGAAADVVEYPTDFFAPIGSEYDSPYYRGANQDWSWTHDAIAGSFLSATLDIRAFDVDRSDGEVDNIYALDGATWTLVGFLRGSSDVYFNTIFDLDSDFFDDINSGLQVMIDIDATNDPNDPWFVSLSSSTLTTTVTPIPEPEIYAMLAVGLGLMGFVARRRKAQAAVA